MSNRHVGGVLVAVLLYLALPSCRTVDYAYYHRVSGTVTNSRGEPVAGAVVSRVETPTSMAVAGVPSLYRRTTDKRGAFLFQYGGLGRKPQARKTWHLLATHAGYRPARATVAVPWVRATRKRERSGYIRSNVMLQLGSAIPRSGRPTSARVKAVRLGAKDLRRLQSVSLEGCSRKRPVPKWSLRLDAPETPQNEAWLVPLLCNDDGKLRLVQLRGGKLWQELPVHPVRQWSFDGIRDIAFEDVNGDGFFDLLLIATAMTGIGPTGARPFPVSGLFLGTASGAWKVEAGANTLLGKLPASEQRVLPLLTALRRHFGAPPRRKHNE